jgi:nicotinamide riboside kinase
MKIAIIGTHGVGKTTLAYQIATEAKKRGKNASIVHEVARSSPFPLNDGFTSDGAHWIITTQIKRELEAKAQKADVIVCDRSAYDPICYLHATDEYADAFQALESFAEEWTKTYDLIFYVVPSWQNLTDDGVRSMDLDYQKRINNEFLYFLDRIRGDNVHEVHDYKIFSSKLDEVYKVIFKC